MKKRLLYIIIIMIILLGILTYKLYNSHNLHNKINLNKTQQQSEKSNFEIGVNIHFIEPNSDQVNKIREAGFKVIRADFTWSSIEKEKSVYDFSHYDKLVDAMDKNNIKILFILDYANDLYDNGLAPYSEDGRRAFSNFAKEAVKHYKGKQIMWEIWNEPNSGFWKPSPNAENYYNLVVETTKQIRTVDKNAFIIAPALADLDYKYLDSLGKLGMFNYIDAVSVHPYRQKFPETAIDDYKSLRELIDKYPHNKNIKIFSGEWGYSSLWDNMDEVKQAQYCAREYLTNIMCGVDLSIWFDWRDDDTDRNYPEHSFGSVYENLQPKETYYAIKTLTSTIGNYKYIKRIDTDLKDDYVLMFKNGQNTIYAVWTSGETHKINISLPDKNIKIVELAGNNYRDKVSGNNYSIYINKSVKYIVLQN